MKYLFSWLLATFALPASAQNAQLLLKNPLPTLYAKCEQEVYFILPEKQAGKNWAYTSNNGTVTLKTQRNDFAILQIKPAMVGKGVITASADKAVENLTFDVVAVPSPTLFMADSLKREVSIQDPIGMLDANQVIAKPNTLFANQLPKEANYEVSGITTSIFRGGRSIAMMRSVDGKLKLETLKDAENKGYLLKSGDGIQVTVEATRLTSDGKTEKVRLEQPYMAFFVK